MLELGRYCWIVEVGLDKSKFGLHSLRSGGITSGANRGVSERLLKAHGRWASNKAKDGYMKDNTQSQMAVSLNLGLYISLISKLLQANKPNPSLISYSVLILNYKLFKFGRFQEGEFKCISISVIGDFLYISMSL